MTVHVDSARGHRSASMPSSGALAARVEPSSEEFGPVRTEVFEELENRMLHHLRSPSALPVFLSGPPGVGKTTCAAAVAASMRRRLLAFQAASPGLRFGDHPEGLKSLALAPLPLRRDVGTGESGRGTVVLIEHAEQLPGGLIGPTMSGLLGIATAKNADALQHYFAVCDEPELVSFVFTSRSPVSPTHFGKVAVLEMHGYTHGEKVALLERALAVRALSVSTDVLNRLVRAYSTGPGLSDVLQALSACAGVGERMLESEIRALLGPPRPRMAEPWCEPREGEAIAMAWTMLGGTPLIIEVALAHGSDTDLRILVPVGDAMRGSAHVALHVVNQSLAEQSLQLGVRTGRPVLVNMPCTAFQIDGPSAGLVMALAMYALATGRPLRPRCAVTGQLSLNGRVLPVSGCTAKLLAAEREGFTSVVLPAANEAEVAPVIRRLGRGFDVKFVRSYAEAVSACFA